MKKYTYRNDNGIFALKFDGSEEHTKIFEENFEEFISKDYAKEYVGSYFVHDMNAPNGKCHFILDEESFNEMYEEVVNFDVWNNAPLTEKVLNSTDFTPEEKEFIKQSLVVNSAIIQIGEKMDIKNRHDEVSNAMETTPLFKESCDLVNRFLFGDEIDGK